MLDKRGKKRHEGPNPNDIPKGMMLSTAIYDVLEGTRRMPMAVVLAWEDLKDRYRRSYLGLAWILLSFAAFILVKTLVFSSIFDRPGYDYFSHLVIGFALFGFISQSIAGAANLFLANRTWILSTNLPHSLYAHVAVFRSLAELFLVSAAALPLVIFLGGVHPGVLWSLPPAIALYYVTAFGLNLMLAPLGARIRDLVHAMRTVMRMLFFATPILWVATPGTTRSMVARWNPVTYYLDILRVPLMKGEFPATAWVICLATSLGVLVLGLIVFSVTKKGVPRWL